MHAKRDALIILSFPFFVFLSIILALGIWNLNHSKAVRTLRYSDTAFEFAKKGNQIEAKIFLEKAVQLDPVNNELKYQLFLTLRRLNDTERSTALLRVLAPETWVVHPPAHHHIVRQVLQRETASKAHLQFALNHAQMVASSRPAKDPAHLLVAECQFRLGNFADAEATLQRIAESELPSRLFLYRLYKKWGKGEKAEKYYADTLHLYLVKLDEEPEKTPLRIALADAYVLKKDFMSAEKVLLKGLQLKPESPSLQLAYIGLVTVWIEEHLRTNAVTETDIVRLLKAFDYKPRHVGLSQLAERIYFGKEPQRTFLVQSLKAEEDADALSEIGAYLLGLEAFSNKRTEEARAYWKAALESWPEFVGPHYVTARLLASDEKPDYDAASKHMAYALKAQPNRLLFWYFQAELLMKANRPLTALAHFERAASLLPYPHPRIENNIAQIYRKQGNLKAEEQHLERAREGNRIYGAPERIPASVPATPAQIKHK